MPNPPMTAKPTKGPLHAVPCPHCGATNDFRDLQETYGATFEPGFKTDCDHCGRHMEVVAVQPVVFVGVRQTGGHTARPGQPPPQPQKQGFLATLFGPPRKP
jgi:hypothetical protein